MRLQKIHLREQGVQASPLVLDFAAGPIYCVSFFVLSILKNRGKISTSRFLFLIPVASGRAYDSYLPGNARSGGRDMSYHRRYKLRDDRFGLLALTLREKVGLTQA